MSGRLKRCVACLMTLLLVFSTPSLCCGEWKTVPQGWTTPEPGVWGDMSTARDTAAALKSRREERDAWRAAVQDLRKELATSAEENARRLDALERQFSEERTAWRSETRKAKGTALLWAILAGGIGFVAGRR